MQPEIIFHDDGGSFVVETRAPAGYLFSQHEHERTHMAYLSQGTAAVEIDGETTQHTGPCMLSMEAHKKHSVRSITPIVWLCIWPWDANMQDAAKASLKLLEGG